jgi:hypothetical protein
VSGPFVRVRWQPRASAALLGGRTGRGSQGLRGRLRARPGICLAGTDRRGAQGVGSTQGRRVRRVSAGQSPGSQSGGPGSPGEVPATRARNRSKRTEPAAAGARQGRTRKARGRSAREWARHRSRPGGPETAHGQPGGEPAVATARRRCHYRKLEIRNPGPGHAGRRDSDATRRDGRTRSTRTTSARCISGRVQSVKFEPPLHPRRYAHEPRGLGEVFSTPLEVTDLLERWHNARAMQRFFGNHTPTAKCIEILDMINRLQHIHMSFAFEF